MRMRVRVGTWVRMAEWMRVGERMRMKMIVGTVGR